ncbi:response regulator transcription factor [Candidatus Pelagibacter sp.]|jgi:DNA-binding response OmpR family regulator|nr:response regulator transcription factor [Candidatus Pelagibacter sp.]
MKVLIIEDSEEFSKSLLDFFNYDGHSTDFAPNLSSAYDYLAVSKFDIILLDIMLPDGDGRDFLKKIRKQNITIPVIVMTARSEVSDKIDLLDIGADDYIIKPFDLNELEARCRAVLRRQSGQNQTYLKFKNLSLYPLLAKIEISGKPTSLRNRELRLLEIFFNSPKIFFTNEQLIDRLFSISETVSENAIEVYIARLRKKIKNSQAKIENIRSIGYRLIEK